MALNLIVRAAGLGRAFVEEKLRASLREIADGRLTLIDDQLIQRGQGLPLLNRFIAEERRRATLIIEGLEMMDQ